jgi:hypothetical protein
VAKTLGNLPQNIDKNDTGERNEKSIIDWPSRHDFCSRSGN